MKRTVPLLITGLAGVILILVDFIPPVTGLKSTTEAFFLIIAAFAAILGAASLLQMHLSKVSRRQSGWGYSLVTVIGFVGTLVIGLGKIGVPPVYGLSSIMVADNGPVAEANITDDTNDVDGSPQFQRIFNVRAFELTPGATVPVRLNGEVIGQMEVDETGRGLFTLMTPLEGDPERTEPEQVLADVTVPQPVRYADEPYEPVAIPVAIGDVLSGEMKTHNHLTGNYLANGAAYWWSYSYVILPLQQTMFALLAFYVASAAFRAFRARNAESVMLLLTAFIILLGRTPAGAMLTGGLLDESIPDWLAGVAAFFYIPNLTDWIMAVWNTAGTRAIIIGIALGIVSTSLKILLGIDRSYLGSDRS